MTQHESGVDLLLAPPDIREVEAVTPAAPAPDRRGAAAPVRPGAGRPRLARHARRRPPSSSWSTRSILVVNPDVASMRGMRRTINAWESLGVCKETDVRVLVNRASKQVTVSMETVRQLTKASVLPVGLPAGFRRLEPALNARDPLAVRGQWWSELRKIGKEVGLVPGSTSTPRASDEGEHPHRQPAPAGPRRGRGDGRVGRDAPARAARADDARLLRRARHHRGLPAARRRRGHPRREPRPGRPAGRRGRPALRVPRLASASARPARVSR